MHLVRPGREREARSHCAPGKPGGDCSGPGRATPARPRQYIQCKADNDSHYHTLQFRIVTNPTLAFFRMAALTGKQQAQRRCAGLQAVTAAAATGGVLNGGDGARDAMARAMEHRFLPCRSERAPATRLSTTLHGAPRGSWVREAHGSVQTPRASGGRGRGGAADTGRTVTRPRRFRPGPGPRIRLPVVHGDRMSAGALLGTPIVLSNALPTGRLHAPIARPDSTLRQLQGPQAYGSEVRSHGDLFKTVSFFV